MGGRYTRLVCARPTPEQAAEIAVVDEIAERLATYLKANTAGIDAVHVFRAQSMAVQRVVGELLKGVGFDEEVPLTPQKGFVTLARPDFYYSLGENRGIIAEIERGGTTTNNHDLKDFWKTHIADKAHHLFLVVPMANWNEAGKARERPYIRVVRRLEAFFGDERREVDVLSAHIFGYGSEQLPPAP